MIDININDTVTYPTADGGERLATVVHIEHIGPVRTLTVLPLGADHDFKIADTEVKVEYPALDIVALTAHLGQPEHDQQAVLAWTGEREGHTWSQVEAASLAIIWANDPAGSDD